MRLRSPFRRIFWWLLPGLAAGSGLFCGLQPWQPFDFLRGYTPTHADYRRWLYEVPADPERFLRQADTELAKRGFTLVANSHWDDLHVTKYHMGEGTSREWVVFLVENENRANHLVVQVYDLSPHSRISTLVRDVFGHSTTAREACLKNLRQIQGAEVAHN